MLKLLLCVLCTTAVIHCYPSFSDCDFPIVSREEWGARPPKGVEVMKNPVPHVIIHHSHSPPMCNTTEQCIKAMQWMQDLHQNTNGWDDIGYSFAVGSDGNAYAGREWEKVGAHAPKYNDKSIGICLIGDWVAGIPPKNQLERVHKLIECGVATGRIQSNYTLFGHRQVRATECPGEALFREIQTWPHFSNDPPHYYGGLEA